MKLNQFWKDQVNLTKSHPIIIKTINYNSIANNFRTINIFGKTQNINKFKSLFGLGEQEIAPISFKATPDLNYGFKSYLNTGNFDGGYQIINDDLEDLENFPYEICFTYLMS